MRWMVAGLMGLAAACASPPEAAEHARVQAHLEGALAMVEAATPKGLTPAQLEARHRLIHLLREYIDAGRFPVNDVSPERTPIFIDRGGTRCAMASLIERTGHVVNSAQRCTEELLIESVNHRDRFVA